GCPTPPPGVSVGSNCWFNGWTLHDNAAIEQHDKPVRAGQLLALGYLKDWRILYCPSAGPTDPQGYNGAWPYSNWGPGGAIWVLCSYMLWYSPDKINFPNPAEKVYGFDSSDSRGNGP